MPTFRENTKLGTFVPLIKTDDLDNQAVTTEKIKDLSVDVNKLADDAVETSKIKDGSVTTDKLADNSVTTPKIKDGNVTTSKLADSSVTTDKIADGNVTTEKINDSAVNTRKIANHSVTTDKLADNSVVTEKLSNRNVTTEKLADKSVTTDKLADNSVTIRQIAEDAISNGKLQDGSVDSRNIQEDAVITNKIADKNVTTEKLAERSVTNSKLADKSITNDKVANNTLTLEKLDADLRDAIEAATGLPSDLLEKVQNLTEDVAELQDSEFPITLYLQVNYKPSTDMANVTYSVNRKGQSLVPDTMILKSGNETLLNTPSSGGMVQALVTHNMHIVTLDVTYGKMSKQASITSYICYSGSSTSDVISSDVLNTLSKSYVPNVSFNPSVTTKNGEYIWLVVPQYLTISSVKSAGFDVTLDTPQTIKTDLGDFKAYRTKNSLTANNWKLVIE